MKHSRKEAALALVLLLAIVFGCMFAADRIQRGNGTIAVTEGWIETDVGNLMYKLYTPKTATAETPAPDVLLLHGYQNDHETCAAYAIKLARRGAVVLCLDEYGHGSTTAGLINRGYVNHKVTVNYGEDSVEDSTFKTIGGQTRYKVMMNFYNLSFFDKQYTTDADGNSMTDSSAGGSCAYALLAAMDNVDPARLAISGHSMGTWSSWSVAANFCGTEFLGCTADEAAWNTTYGSFEDGTARRMELLNTNHRLTTHNAHGLATALTWFSDTIGLDLTLAPTDQVAMTKETPVLIAMLAAVASLMAVMELLLTTPFFSRAVQPLPGEASVKPNGAWWRGAIITMLLAAATYPFMTQLGHGLLPLPENIFRMTVGNGFLSWYLLLILIMLVTSIIGYQKNKKRGAQDGWQSMGLGTAAASGRMGWGLLGRCALLVLCMLAYLYVLLLICEKAFLLDFRFIWPVFKTFDAARFGQFCVYLPVFALFFILNNSKIMASARCKATYQPGFKGFLGCWWRNALMMVGGILIIVLIEYIPFFMNIAPGADLLFGSTFGGPFMSLLILFVPQVLVFSVLCTYTYRRTGSVYVGALTAASLACWIVTGGSSMLQAEHTKKLPTRAAFFVISVFLPDTDPDSRRPGRGWRACTYPPHMRPAARSPRSAAGTSECPAAAPRGFCNAPGSDCGSSSQSSGTPSHRPDSPRSRSGICDTDRRPPPPAHRRRHRSPPCVPAASAATPA